MSGTPSLVLSASRRTDIPAFYLDWFIDRIKKQSFLIHNPYNNQERRVCFSAGEIHSIVFWSKNFSPLLSRRSELRGHNLFFNFTINSDSKVLEPGVPPLKKRLEQVREMAEIYGPGTIQWRFDPIVFWLSGGTPYNNLKDFEFIAEKLAGAGIKSCTISFMDRYAKIDRREKAQADFRFVYPSLEEQVEIMEPLLDKVSRLGMTLYTCCEKALLSRLENRGAKRGHCVDVPLLQRLYGGNLIAKPDYGQRRKAGCGCYRSLDVGSYRDQPCLHRCLYCYANPSL